MRADDLNLTLEREHPAAFRMLSPLGRRSALPLGIPQQAAQSRQCELQATIGEITDGLGNPMALGSLLASFPALDPKQAFLYAPPSGNRALREAWARRIAVPGVPASLPLVTGGVTQGLALCADLFGSPSTPLLLGTPYWDNYDVTFGMRTGMPLRPFPFYDGDHFNLAGLGAALDALTGPGVVLLNFPNNPTGYSPAGETGALVERLLAHTGPLVVICDDAYHSFVYEPGVLADSLYDQLAAKADPSRLLVCRADGATKEMVFFGGRVGFLTFSAEGAAGEALVEKATALLRGTVSSLPAPSQLAVLRALSSPSLPDEIAAVRAELAVRYRALRAALDEVGLRAAPFNSGCFALLPLPDHLDAETVRQRLIHEQSVGVIAVPSANALRVAFCSMRAETFPELTRRMVRVIGRTA